MIATIAASAALFAASAIAGNVGHAIVINSCAYDVHLSSVPSAGGGQSESNTILHTGDTWSQQWTELTNTMGWSIKLSKTAVMSNIMQYEYTYHGDNTIWYDLSEVDGNPWRGNFMITAQSDGNNCKPRQAAYRYSTDDAYGMQDCTADAVITVTLCSADGVVGNAVSSIANAVSSVVSQIAAAPSSTTSTTAPVVVHELAASSQAVQVSSIVQPTTLSTSSIPATTSSLTTSSSTTSSSTTSSSTTSSSSTPVKKPVEEIVTMTDYVTVDMTVTAYATPAPRKRHEHHRGRHAGHN